jgi:serpin B
MKKTLVFRWICGWMVLAFLSLQLAACSAPSTGQIKVLQSQVERNLIPQVGPADFNALVQGNSAFAFDLYQKVRAEDGNQFFSPLSLSLALAMTYAGAQGETANQMAQTLHFTLPQERIHPAFNDLDLQLTAQPETGKDEPQPFQLSIANSLWGEQTFTFLPEFLDTISLNYGAGLRLLDFIGAPETSRGTINKWVEQETHEKIKNLVPKGAITPATRLVLANAIYFKADWVNPFSSELTLDMPFNLLDGGQTSVSMMRMDGTAGLDYAVGDGFQAVELPYVGDRISMLVLVPDLGKFSNFEANLNDEKVASIRNNLEIRQVELSFPKFSFETSLSLATVLQQMGMVNAFDAGRADFSGMDGKGQLYISDIFHKAFVAVDEKGTEAAAASAVLMKATAEILPDVQLTIDRPFIFLILDKASGSILFVGRFVQP